MTEDMSVLPLPPFCLLLTGVQDGLAGIQPSHVPTGKTTLQAPKYDQEGTL